MVKEKKNIKTAKCESKDIGQWMALGAGMGVAIGTGIGAALDNISLGVGVGVAIGAAAGMVLGQADKKDNGKFLKARHFRWNSTLRKK